MSKNSTLDEMSDEALIAAIMDDSHGYASPHHARQHVEQYANGERFAYCERAVSCFPADDDAFADDDRAALTGHPPGDLQKLLESARQHWLRLSEERREDLLGLADEWANAESPGELSSISLLYPTQAP